MHTFTVKVCHSVVSKTLHYGASTIPLFFYILKVRWFQKCFFFYNRISPNLNVLNCNTSDIVSTNKQTRQCTHDISLSSLFTMSEYHRSTPFPEQRCWFSTALHHYHHHYYNYNFYYHHHHYFMPIRDGTTAWWCLQHSRTLCCW
jgi:hypothetical protein